jgi:carboxyl-terminal processing protease
MRRSATPKLVFLAGLIGGLGIGWTLARWSSDRSRGPVATAQLFEHVLSAIRSDFVDSLSDEELYVKAAQGVVSTLGDPYSSFLGPAEFREYRDRLKGRGTSFGLTFETGLTGLRIASTAPGSAADVAGLAAGDLVLEIGGVPMRQASPGAAMTALRADSTGVAVLRSQSPGDSVPLDVTLEAAPLRLGSVGPAVRLSDSIGYLALRTVTDHASREVRDGLVSLRAGQLSGLVLDLRGNTGGRLDEAIAIANLFLSPGQRIGTVAKRRLQRGYSAKDPDSYPNLALTLLVDRRTASSAEIIAAALRDNERASLVGERTYGKGLIQTTIPIGDSIAVRLTTGRWQGPGGGLIAGGLRPDSAVRLTEWETSLRRALAPRVEVLAQVLSQVAARWDSGGRAIDSVRLDRADQDLIRGRLRQSGLTLSRRTLVRHRHLFESEVARLVAARSGTPLTAVRFALLTDPVVTAAIATLQTQITSRAAHQ